MLLFVVDVKDIKITFQVKMLNRNTSVLKYNVLDYFLTYQQNDTLIITEINLHI